jgi:hypothetical protein
MRRPRSARSWTRSIEAPARYSSQVARIVSGFLKQRRYWAKASGLEHRGITQAVAQEELGLGADQPFGQPARLDQKEPVIARGRGLLIDRLETVERRHDVEQCQALDALGMIARKAVGDARAAVVAGDGEALEAQRPHRLDLVEGERALRIGRIVGAGRRLGAVAIAAQIGGDDSELRR